LADQILQQTKKHTTHCNCKRHLLSKWNTFFHTVRNRVLMVI